MEILRDWFHPMTLTQLLEAYEIGSIPDNAVVVTFDDGYHDFVDYGLPILKELRIPATLFVTTGFVNRELWLWPDQIRYALEKTAKDFLTLSFNQERVDLRSGKEEAWNTIADHCMTVSDQEKKALILRLFDDLGVPIPSDTPEEYRALTWEQVKNAVKDGIEVGSHSHSHPILTQLNREELIRELALSKDQIIKELGIFPKLFCYPNGQDFDFDEKVKSAVLDAGYLYAVSAFPGRYPLEDLLAINRYPASNCIESYEKNVFGLSFLRF